MKIKKLFMFTAGMFIANNASAGPAGLVAAEELVRV